MFSPIRSLWIYAQLIVSFFKLTLISTFTKLRFFSNPFCRKRINTERAIEIRYQISLSEKKCPYEVLGLSRDCSAEEIRSAYKRLALFRHPDKLVRAGVPESEATAIFQELVRAHEILSDTQKREAYDSERNKIVYSTATANSKSGFSGFVPDLSSFFSDSVYKGFSDKGRGFYKVYGDLFEKIYIHELKKVRYPLPEEPPIMGNLESPDVQVTAFYDYWLGFVTSLDFAWADEHDVTAGTNKKSRRAKEDENMKLRKRAIRDYNETVRALAKFVMKMDKRVIEMEAKKNEEMEKKREEERAWREEMDRQKAERVRNYVEPEWAKVEEVDDDIYDDNVTENLIEKKELFCIACKKKFKSDEQWKNHEKSKKHKEKVAGSRN